MPTVFKRAIVVLILAAFSLPANAQAVETYRAKKSDTMQTIADRFGMTVDELLEYNKEYKGREVKARDILVVPSKKERKERERQKELAALNPQPAVPAPPKPVEFTTHVVAPKETVYGISRQWGITQDMLKEYNPELKTSVLKIGMELRIPVVSVEDKVLEPTQNQAQVQTQPQTQGRPQVFTTSGQVTNRLNRQEQSRPETRPQGQEKPRDTAQSSSWMVGVDTVRHDAPVAAPAAEQLDVTRFLKVDVMLPFYLDRADSLIGAPPAKRLADSQVALSFYMGVKMALDSLAGQGLVADVRVFDTRRDTAAVDSLMRVNDFSQTDVIIGPLFAEIVERVARNLDGKKAIVVSPFSTKHNVVGSSNILQVSASAEDLQDAMLRYMKDNMASPQHIVIVASSTQQGAQIEKIKRALSSVAGSAGIAVLDTDLGENARRLGEMIKQGVPMSLVVPALTSSTTVEVLQAVEQSNRLDEVDVYGFEADTRAKKLMEDTQGQAAARTRFIYAERHFENMEKAQHHDFVRGFRKRYREVPGTYSLSGFDVTYDLLTRMAVEPDNEKAITSHPSEQVADRFRFIKYLGGGYINTDVYILMHDARHGTVLLY